MGGWRSNPYPLSLKDLEDLGKDQEKCIDKGCTSRIAGKQEASAWWAGFSYPKNGEFEFGWSGQGCEYCPTEVGKECWGGIGADAVRPCAKRIAFKAKKEDCCLANSKAVDINKTVGNYTCNSEYRDPNKTECNAFFSNYCSGNNIVDKEECRNLLNTNSTLYNARMKEHCNWNNDNALSARCVDFCNAGNSTSCTTLNNLKDCNILGINKADCTPAKALDVKNKCKKYGMLSEQGLPIGSYQCNENGISSLERQCKKLNISLDTCTTSGIDTKEAVERSISQAKEAAAQSAAQFEQTQQALRQVLNLSNNTTLNVTENDTKSKDNTIIIIVIIIIIIMLSSVGVMLVL